MLAWALAWALAVVEVEQEEMGKIYVYINIDTLKLSTEVIENAMAFMLTLGVGLGVGFGVYYGLNKQIKWGWAYKNWAKQNYCIMLKAGIRYFALSLALCMLLIFILLVLLVLPFVSFRFLFWK